MIRAQGGVLRKVRRGIRLAVLAAITALLAIGCGGGGGQRRLEIARALASQPKRLLLDEPSMGLAPVLVELIFQTIQEINQQGTTILLVEQNANVALEIASRGYVLETGRIVNSASAEKLRQDPKVREAYLGEM